MSKAAVLQWWVGHAPHLANERQTEHRARLPLVPATDDEDELPAGALLDNIARYSPSLPSSPPHLVVLPIRGAVPFCCVVSANLPFSAAGRPQLLASPPAHYTTVPQRASASSRRPFPIHELHCLTAHTLRSHGGSRSKRRAKCVHTYTPTILP